MASGDADLARTCLRADNVNQMAADEPPACALPGLAGFLATSAWLRYAFSDLAFEVVDHVADAERAIAHVWFRGRQTGPFVVFPAGAAPVSFPPTGRAFAVRQTHVFRTRDGLHAEHVAVRDDLGMMTQLGHLPPSPRSLARMARWTIGGGARRSVAEVVALSAAAAA
ncbi:MAG: ester cyclase [Actinobacteria bacterium]|nr:ester cyclase [Actinomycetota bacterium]